jgi:hypothetical protein
MMIKDPANEFLIFLTEKVYEKFICGSAIILKFLLKKAGAARSALL